jgi:glycosyltransferase involved in cell wall biosynthesis
MCATKLRVFICLEAPAGGVFRLFSTRHRQQIGRSGTGGSCIFVRIMPPLHIAVNARMLIRDQLEGIGLFSREVLRRITTAHPEVRFLFLFDRPWQEEFIFSSNITPVRVFPPARHPLLWMAWFEYSVPAVLRRYRPDLFLSPDGHLSLRSSVPSLAVMHDINFAHYPGDLPFAYRTYYNYFFPRFAHKARRLATVSEFSKKDISVRYGLLPERIDVVYNGASEKFRPYPAPCIQNVRQRLTGGHPYFILVSSLHRRKNIVNLLKAYDLFRQRTDAPVRLVFAGSRRWWTADMQRTWESLPFRSDVVFTGRISEQQLVDYTAAALAAVYPSTFEGFGIPMIEAMQSGVPVITSNITAMPEIAGGAALLTDPFSAESIAGALLTVSADEQLRRNLAEAGLKRAQDFSWDRTAGLLWDSLMKIT